MLIDTHAHLDFPEFGGELPAIFSRAAAAEVSRIITISTSLDSCERAVALATEHPNVWAAVGVHPSNACEAPEDFIALLRQFANRPRVVAIGECGLDYHRLPSSQMHEAAVATSALGNETPANITGSLGDGAVKAQQATVFRQQLELAVETGLPVIIHERDAWDDTVALLTPFAGQVRAVFHCFGKSIEHARAVIAMGHLVSFTGIVTFKNARDVQTTAGQVPVGSFMVETDCPFLAPVPHRGERCEPAHTRDIALQIARLRGVTLEQLAAQTSTTADNFFHLTRQ